MIDFEAITRKHEELRRKSKAADTLRERATDISVHFSDMPRGGGGNKQEQIRVELVAAQEAAVETEKELREMLRPLRLKMRRLKKWQHVSVVRKRYIEGKPVAQIAVEIGYELRQTNRYIFDAKAIINR